MTAEVHRDNSGAYRHQIKSEFFDIQPELDGGMGELASVLSAEGYLALAVKVVMVVVRSQCPPSAGYSLFLKIFLACQQLLIFAFLHYISDQ